MNVVNAKRGSAVKWIDHLHFIFHKVELVRESLVIVRPLRVSLHTVNIVWLLVSVVTVVLDRDFELCCCILLLIHQTVIAFFSKCGWASISQVRGDELKVFLLLVARHTAQKVTLNLGRLHAY